MVLAVSCAHVGLVCDATVDEATHAHFKATDAGSGVAGTCQPGYGPGESPPSRECKLNGVWGTVTGTCKRASAAR